jgi:hypothetical protein
MVVEVLWREAEQTAGRLTCGDVNDTTVLARYHCKLQI